MSDRPRRAECREIELSLGVLLVGALDPAERPAVEAHLADCPRCTALLAELAPLPGLLHRVDPLGHEAATPGDEAPPLVVTLGPPKLRDRLVEAARTERTRQHRRWAVGAGIAAAIVGVLLGVGVVAGVGDGSRDTGATVASATDPRSDVRADVRLVSADTGTEVGLRLAGVAPEEHCRLVAVDNHGRRDVAATWVATYHGEATVTGHTAFQADDIKQFLVITSKGQTLVRVPVHT
jgi:anti-sigma factor RsiW